MKWPEIAEKLGRDLVESVRDRMLLDYLRLWNSQQNEFGRLLNTAGLTHKQRRVVWRLLASAVEDSYHHFVHWLDEKVESGELAIRLIDKDKPENSRDWQQAQVGMPFGFSADMLERYGADPEALYDAAPSSPKPPSES